MSSKHTLKTMFIWHDSAGNECEAEVIVTYSVDPGFAGDRIDPPYDASVEIISVVPVIAEYDIPENSVDHDALCEECMADWRDDGPDPDDWRDARIDDRLTGGDA